MLRPYGQKMIHSPYIDYVQSNLNNLGISDVWLHYSVNAVKISVLKATHGAFMFLIAASVQIEWVLRTHCSKIVVRFYLGFTCRSH